MALTSTIYNFEVDLADADRGVYESLALRVARHPSESEDLLLTRVLAHALEFEPGIEFSPGLCNPDEPALWIRDPTGALRAWIEVGTPDAARLHKAAKASPRVVVYNHKDVTQWLGSTRGRAHPPGGGDRGLGDGPRAAARVVRATGTADDLRAVGVRQGTLRLDRQQHGDRKADASNAGMMRSMRIVSELRGEVGA